MYGWTICCFAILGRRQEVRDTIGFFVGNYTSYDFSGWNNGFDGCIHSHTFRNVHFISRTLREVFYVLFHRFVSAPTKLGR
ncbi:hypothetical protein NY2A_b308L [Paramecium bursaria Chlorella virus NY2A]|uniref:Uncharacterized protein b308L n=1 Tax=Paramecium bursaria Chlorella virus NY2A TaxID=46021 RepID=A7IWI3_PBCVN|nr:hypothetical protein NY2A_b308L [Paramecium bursaria Chlorella virus NY2A]ABT14707.1 hypothetical protein NY2A_b308L [Paramecium bursaria Chlorella virus NY2A]